MDNKQKFGLIIPKKEEKKPTSSFIDNLDDDSLSDNENNFDYKKEINKNIAKQTAYCNAKLSEQMSINLASDANFYEYDSVYNEASKSKPNNAIKVDSNNKPKYLGAILAATEKRKIEQSLIKEKVETKRREREENDYGEKPKYLTKAYKESLNLSKETDMINTLNDKYDEKKTVNSEYGMIGFYSNLLTRNTLFENNQNSHDIIQKNDEEKRNIVQTYKADKTVQENKIKSIDIKPIDPISQIKKEIPAEEIKNDKINVEDYKKRFLERKRIRNETQ